MRTISEFANALRARAIIEGVFDPEEGLEYYQTKESTYPGRNTDTFREVSLSYCLDGDWRQRAVIFGEDEEFLDDLDYSEVLKESIEVMI